MLSIQSAAAYLKLRCSQWMHVIATTDQSWGYSSTAQGVNIRLTNSWQGPYVYTYTDTTYKLKLIHLHIAVDITCTSAFMQHIHNQQAAVYEL
jgi:hypothetical protein